MGDIIQPESRFSDNYRSLDWYAILGHSTLSIRLTQSFQCKSRSDCNSIQKIYTLLLFLDNSIVFANEENLGRGNIVYLYIAIEWF